MYSQLTLLKSVHPNGHNCRYIASVASKIYDHEWSLSKLATDKYMQDTLGIAFPKAAEVIAYRSNDTLLFPTLPKIPKADSVPIKSRGVYLRFYGI